MMKTKGILKIICAISLAACMLTGYALPSVGAATTTAAAAVGAAASGSISASGLGEYTPTGDLKTNRIYFALPSVWLNDETERVGNTPGVYWFSGADQPDNVAPDGHGWPGYRMKKAEEEGVSNLFYIDVPEGNGSEDLDVTMLVWNNYLDAGTDKTNPIYMMATQSADFSCQYYSLGDSDLYDEEFFAYIYLKTFESLGYDYDLDSASDTFWEDINRAAAEELGEDYDSTDPNFRQYFIYDLFDIEDDKGNIDLTGVFGDYGSNFFDERWFGLGMSFTFDNMVYVVDLDPNRYSVNYEGKRTYIGGVFFYYGGGEYGQYPTKQLNEEMNGVGGNFMDSKYLRSELLDFTYEENSGGGITITGYFGRDKEIVIPSEIDGKPVTKIGEDAFSNRTGIAKVTIGNNVTSIGNRAFNNCIRLSSVMLGNSITEIGERAFSGCKVLTSVTFPKGITEIKDYTFSGCEGLVSIALPDNITSIGNHAFRDCKRLTSVTTGNGVTKIGAFAFDNCERLSNITLGYNVSEIGNYAISSCDYMIIYGYRGSYAETYAYNNIIPFIALSVLEDSDTNISVTGILDDSVELNVIEQSVDDVNISDNSKTVRICYDITLMESSKEVQPNDFVTVKIPFTGDYTNVEVYRINDNGTTEKMQSTYDGEYITFTTDHFSKYAIVTEAETAILGDINGDGKVNAKDRMELTRYLSHWTGYEEISAATADVNSDGKVNVKDRMILTRHLANWSGYETLPVID